MVSDHHNNCFQFFLSEAKVSGFLLDAEYSECPQFFIQNLPLRFEAWIRSISHEGVSRVSNSKKSCILLSRKSDKPPDSQERLVGARFFVENTSSDARAYTLVYDCPLVYTVTKPIDDTPPSRPDAYPEMKASLMLESARISLDCGKTSKHP